MRKSTVAIVVLNLLFAGLAFGADKKIILPPGAKPGGNYSPGILIDGTLYISGQGGEDAAGKVPGDFDAEVKQSLENIGAVLQAAGMSPADVVSVQVYLTDGGQVPANECRLHELFQGSTAHPGTTVVVAKLVGPGNIEITVTARK